MVDIQIPKHTVIQYVRNKKRVPYGVLVAVKSAGGFTCGYSLCNKKDRFSKKMALKIAIGRASPFGDYVTVAPDCGEGVPHEVKKMFPAFFDRCRKYYKVGEAALKEDVKDDTDTVTVNVNKKMKLVLKKDLLERAADCLSESVCFNLTIQDMLNIFLSDGFLISELQSCAKNGRNNLTDTVVRENFMEVFEKYIEHSDLEGEYWEDELEDEESA